MPMLLQQLRILLTARDKWRMVLLSVMMMTTAGLEMVGVSILMPIIAVLTKPELLAQNRYLKLVHDLIAPGNDREFMLAMCLLVVVFFVAKNLFSFFTLVCQSRFIYRKLAEFSERLFKNYLGAPYRFHLSHNSAELAGNIGMVNENIGSGFLLPLMLIVTESFVIAGLSLLLLILAPWVTLAAVGVILITLFLFYFPFKSYYYRQGARLVEGNLAARRSLHQGLGAVKETLVRHKGGFFLGEFSRNLRKVSSTLCRLYVFGQVPRFGIETCVILIALGGLAVLVAGGMAEGSILLTVALFGVALFRLLPSVTRLHYNLALLRQNRCLFDNLFRELTELSSSRRPAIGGSIHFEKELRVEGLSFGYDPANPILKDLSLSISRNRIVGFTGPTGCGKTTLVDLLIGLLEPDRGAITVDGRPIGENLPSWQQQIGYVPQNIYILDDTIRRNVAFGIPEAEIDEKAVWEALENAQIAGFVRSLPRGLDEPLAEFGARLSGGQRQRIGIARALYFHPSVLILDEATSALDLEPEQAFADALDRLRGTVTILLIAHRPATIAKCDDVIRLTGVAN